MRAGLLISVQVHIPVLGSGWARSGESAGLRLPLPLPLAHAHGRCLANINLFLKKNNLLANILVKTRFLIPL